MDSSVGDNDVDADGIEAAVATTPSGNSRLAGLAINGKNRQR